MKNDEQQENYNPIIVDVKNYLIKISNLKNPTRKPHWLKKLLSKANSEAETFVSSTEISKFMR